MSTEIIRFHFLPVFNFHFYFSNIQALSQGLWSNFPESNDYWAYSDTGVDGFDLDI